MMLQLQNQGNRKGYNKNEKKELEKKLDDKIAYIAKIESNIKVDTLEVHDTVIIKDSSAINIKFNYNDQWLKFSGGTYYKNGKSKTERQDFRVYEEARKYYEFGSL